MLKINRHIIQLSNFKSLKSYVLILLVACTALFYGHLIGANQTETGPDSDLPRWKMLEQVVQCTPTASLAPDQASDINSENNNLTTDASEAIEPIRSEVSTVSPQADDTASENIPSDGPPSKLEELTTQEPSETKGSKPNLRNTTSHILNYLKEHGNKSPIKELIIVILAVVFSVLVASCIVPAKSGFQARPIIASLFAIFIASIIILIAKNVGSNWSLLLTIIVLSIIASGWSVNLVADFMNKVTSFLNVLLYVGAPTAIFGSIILIFSSTNEIQLLVITTTIICMVGGSYLAYTQEVNQLAQSLFNRQRSSQMEETSEPQNQPDDESAA